MFLVALRCRFNVLLLPSTNICVMIIDVCSVSACILSKYVFKEKINYSQVFYQLYLSIDELNT